MVPCLPCCSVYALKQYTPQHQVHRIHTVIVTVIVVPCLPCCSVYALAGGLSLLHGRLSPPRGGGGRGRLLHAVCGVLPMTAPARRVLLMLVLLVLLVLLLLVVLLLWDTRDCSCSWSCSYSECYWSLCWCQCWCQCWPDWSYPSYRRSWWTWTWTLCRLVTN